MTTPADDLRTAAAILRTQWESLNGGVRLVAAEVAPLTLAVAAWLEQVADQHRPYLTWPAHCRNCYAPLPCPDLAAALVVARAIGSQT